MYFDFSSVSAINQYVRKIFYWLAHALRFYFRFRVTMELIKPEKPDPATTFKGLDYIDVPGLSKKEYKIHFYAHKEGTFSSKVNWTNSVKIVLNFIYTGVNIPYQISYCLLLGFYDSSPYSVS